MAILVAKRHALLTLVPEIESGAEGLGVRLALRKGAEPMIEARLPLDALGVPARRSAAALRAARMALPDDPGLARLIDAIESRAAPGRPLWLHIPRGSALLALFPWETAFYERLGVPVLGIPNFLHDPFRFGQPVRYVICASAPEAKAGGDQVAGLTDALISALLKAADWAASEIEIHLFADRMALAERDRLPAEGEGPAVHPIGPGRTVVIHDPADTAAFTRPGASRHVPEVGGGAVANPWLRWMAERLEGQPVDIVHFLCPGYLDRLDGALALAVSPLDNTDPNWARFLGAAELGRFLDGLGAQGLGLHPLFEDEWAIGLRHLAWQMTWLRPGPVLSCRYGSMGDAAVLHAVLAHGASEGLSFEGRPFLNLHPRHLAEMQDGNDDFSARASRAVEAGREMFKTLAGTDLGALAVLLRRSVHAPRQRRVPRLQRIGADQPPEQPAWIEAAERQIDTRRAQLMTVEAATPRQRLETAGAAEALDFVAELVRRQAAAEEDSWPAPLREDDENGGSAARGGEPEAGME